MSHLHERKEKVCLNCGAQLAGRFCHDCGQENLEPKESFLHLTKHFLEDLTHFDGKFFVTIKYLLFRPGFLTSEYVKGRRASYLNPIRMYLFISAFFFLIYMSFFVGHSDVIKETHSVKPKDTSEARKTLRSVRVYLDSVAREDGEIDTTNYDAVLPETLREYDSIQNSLPADKKAPFAARYLSRKAIEIRAFNKTHPGEVGHRFREKFFHSLPYLLFISVPLIALLLQLLYVRRRKEFYYVSHIIFTLHYYCTVFLLYLLILLSDLLPGRWELLGLIPFLAMIFYLYKAMRKFYHQGRGKTIIKFFIFSLLGVMIILLLSLGLVFKSLADIAS